MMNFRHIIISLIVVTYCITLGDCKRRHRQFKKAPESNDRNIFEDLSIPYWTQQGIDTLKARQENLQRAGFPSLDKYRRARNVILMIGDGMGMSTVSAIRKFKEEDPSNTYPFYLNELNWDSFPFTGLARNYETDAVVADSAGTATAYHGGSKTRYGYVGVDSTADEYCESDGGFVDSIATRAQEVGKVSGLVTTTTITHASPSPLYAHSPHRFYEFNGTDSWTGETYYLLYPQCIDLAQQFVNRARHIKVALGGGGRNFLPESEQFVADGKNGRRLDNRNLLEEWLADRSAGGKKAQFVSNADDLFAIDRNLDYLMGMFSSSHMPYVDDGRVEGLPTLADMAEVAIDVLDRNPNGYTLFIEGGRIDHGHHDGVARYALTEGLEFDRAVKRVLELVDLSETLIVLSADHSHTMTMGGQLAHSSSALALSDDFAMDLKNFTAINYGNGPGFELEGGSNKYEGKRKDMSQEEATANKYHQQAAAPLDTETHAAEDVPVYATGIYSELFTGVFEQSYISWAMSCAAGINGIKDGNMREQLEEICPFPVGIDPPSTAHVETTTSGSTTFYPTGFIATTLLLLQLFLK